MTSCTNVAGFPLRRFEKVSNVPILHLESILVCVPGWVVEALASARWPVSLAMEGRAPVGDQPGPQHLRMLTSDQALESIAGRLREGGPLGEWNGENPSEGPQ
jgi:hypothetical protein